MTDYLLTKEEFDRWLAGYGYQPPAAIIPHPAMSGLEKILYLKQMADEVYKEPETRRSKSDRCWILIRLLYSEIAVNRSNGTVVVKSRYPRRFTLWIRADGSAGTRSNQRLPISQLATRALILEMVSLIDTLRFWANENRHQVPQGPSLLLRDAREAFAERERLQHQNEGSGTAD
jgi:hypothetical protein